MRVPAIVTDARGCRQAVEHERNGLIVPLKRPESLAGAICRIVSDRRLAGRMGNEGRRLAEERFDEQAVFARVISHYQRLLKEKGIK